MPEQELNSAAAKFISSLVKSLQILCNGQVEFAESIELVGHINVKVDHKYKFDYIVDEQVSKEGEDSSTTFLSNSYHSCPPLKQQSKKASPSHLDQDVMFTEIPQNVTCRSRQSSANIESEAPSQDFQTEGATVGCVDNNLNYSVTVESPSRRESQASQMVVKLEGGDDSNDCMVLPASPESQQNQTHGRSRKRRQPIDQGDSSVKETVPSIVGYPGSREKQDSISVQLKKTPGAAFSCREYLERYNSVYTRQKLSSKQEMIKVFSDLSQKYGVAITIKPAKYATLSTYVTGNDSVSTSSLLTTPVGSPNLHKVYEREIGKTPNEVHTSNVMSALPHATESNKIADQPADILLSISSADNLPIGSQVLTVIATDTGTCDNQSQSHHQDSQTTLHVPYYNAKQRISDNDVINSETARQFSAPEIMSSSTQHIGNQAHISFGSSLSTDKSFHVPLCQFPVASKTVTQNAAQKCATEAVEPDPPTSALLSAIAVALAKEEMSTPSSPEFLRQQPTPKRNRNSYLIRLRKEDPERYEQYKSLSKEEQARERRRISEANRDPDAVEMKSLINRVLYLRKVGKLPPSLRDKSNDEIRQIPTHELKEMLPPTKSLKHMDPAAKEEWYRLGRSREWRRRKKLLDPEGFKRYNNERAKKYQDKLRQSNPEKFKELRAKAADRLRQYRFSQRIMKAIKEGKEIKISEAGTDSCGGRQKRARGRKKNGDMVELKAEELLIEENVDKAHYMIPECATTHGEAATSRESSSTQTIQPEQPDILDLMYNY